ncbi:MULTISPECIES: flagellar export protein FliJ [Thalassobacillus]|uniref:flagellar export protein FliJ n=1 Tax=Thalassobacillus TaxID=331971 RepID=UPI00159345A4|nr:flagellar export protein FliJ [Thalassobacillus devorans]
MASIQAFHKIRDVHENDKLAAQETYQQAVKKFEEIAEHLYRVLKKKEETEEQLHEKITGETLTAHHFAQLQHYITRLDQQIVQLQPEVNQARSYMENCRRKMTEAHVEVKKFDKLIDRKVKQWQDSQKEIEKKQMDELSLRQFLLERNR